MVLAVKDLGLVSLMAKEKLYKLNIMSSGCLAHVKESFSKKNSF
jgi:hypothetical protein